MSDRINKAETSKTFFSLKEGSNYKVLMTYEREEVIEFEQYKKLIQVLNNLEVSFVTINQRIVNKTTIIDISPTADLTIKQKEEKEKAQKETQETKNLKDALEKLKRICKADYMNEKYGENGWTDYKLINTSSMVHITSAKDREEVNKLFKLKHPEEAKLVEDMSKN